jgi:hypothetical protein
MRRLALLLLALAAPAAWGCGVCAEDKMAATYDHAVVQRASANGRVVVFCELAGAVDVERVRKAAKSVRGLDASSVRISANPAALSFALDSTRQSPDAAAAAVQRALDSRTRVKVLRVLGPKAASR